MGLGVKFYILGERQVSWRVGDGGWICYRENVVLGERQVSLKIGNRGMGLQGCKGRLWPNCWERRQGLYEQKDVLGERTFVWRKLVGSWNR